MNAILIACALKYNTNLEELCLGNNNVTEFGSRALRKAVYDDTSLYLTLTSLAVLMVLPFVRLVFLIIIAIRILIGDTRFIIFCPPGMQRRAMCTT